MGLLRYKLGTDVFKTSVGRIQKQYEEGNRVVVSFSGGKDSGICVEVCKIAAENSGRLPVEVQMRDEEIMAPGTFEYAEKISKEKGIKFYWFVENQPIINAYNRTEPYWWVFDPLLSPKQWVRMPPEQAIFLPDKCIDKIVSTNRFPPEQGKKLINVIGLRASESRRRTFAIMSAKGYLSKPNSLGTYRANLIYDWTAKDVWKAINDYKFEYNHVYDVLARASIPIEQQRVAPPTIVPEGYKTLRILAQAYPNWFDKVCNRLPGVRNVTYFGKRAIQPNRRYKETWQDCFERECIKEAPKWVAERATTAKDTILRLHTHHSNQPFPQQSGCLRCQPRLRNWKDMAFTLYNGDPFSIRVGFLPYIEPEVFRKGAGTWGGKPSW